MFGLNLGLGLGGDLMSGTYTYDALKEKYGDFCAPLIKIKDSGVDLVSTMNLSIMDFKVTLSLEAASMVVFRLGDVYDEQSHSFDSKVKNKFKLGSILEVEVGYFSSTLKIFKGFVAMLRAEFGKTTALVVTLMDARRLMMLSGNRQLLHDEKNYSEIVHKILNDYTKLCFPNVDSTFDNLDRPVSQQHNDYLFITRDIIQSGKADREFFVLGDQVYFRTPRKVKSSIMTLTLGRELYTLQTEESYLDMKIEVLGYNEFQKAHKGKEKVDSIKKQDDILTSTPTYVISDPDADTLEKANERAKAIADARQWDLRSARGVTVGLPELVPGRFVEVKNLESDFGNHKYYITEVVHEIDEERFQTTFEAGGWI